MGYKRIGSALHNFAHSFMSYMNYVEGEYIIDVLPHVIRERSLGSLTISFPAGAIMPQAEYPRSLSLSVGYWAATFSRHFRSENADPTIIDHVRLVMRIDESGLICDAEAVDDRGKHYTATIRPTRQ